MAAAQAAENHGDEWGLTWYFLWSIYTSIPTWTHSQNSLAAAEALSSRIFAWNISQMITKSVLVSTRIVISYAMKRESRCEFDGKSMETETTRWSAFPNGEKAIKEQILASEERSKSKIAGLWESESGIGVGKLTIWVNKAIWDRKILTEFTRSISSTRIVKSVLMMDVKVSKDKNSRWVDRENLIYVTWNRIENRARRWRRWSIEEKRSKTVSEVKPVENIIKNLQSFLEISPVQKEVFL